MKKEIYSLKSLLNYNNNYKVKMVKKVSNVFGIKFGRYILKIYLFLKNKELWFFLAGFWIKKNIRRKFKMYG